MAPTNATLITPGRTPILPLSDLPFTQNPGIYTQLGLGIELPTGLIFDPSLLPSNMPSIKQECVNDIQNRRRKMKKHKRRKWMKKFASLVRKRRLLRRKKSERKLQELFQLWRTRTEAWDPADKIQQRLMFARRSGYFVDILSTRGGLENK